MANLADKRVAVVGTGATAVQCIPYLAKDAGHLYVVQRTPSNVNERGNKLTDPNWFSSLKPGWHRERMDNFIETLEGVNQGEDLVDDAWTHLLHDTVTSLLKPDGSPVCPETLEIAKEIADFRKGNELRGRVDAHVKDPQTAESLKAWYPIFCKRPTFNDEYLKTFNRPNVTLINTEGKRLDRIGEKSMIFEGKDYPVDCIIFATGFQTANTYSGQAAVPIYGASSTLLAEKFSNGLRTLHGMLTHDFPNFFMMGISQNSFKANFTDLLDEQAEHILKIITKARSAGKTKIETTKEAEDAWCDEIDSLRKDYLKFLNTCTPGYYSGEGDAKKGFLAETYSPGAVAFSKVLRRWLDEDMPGITISGSYLEQYQ